MVTRETPAHGALVLVDAEASLARIGSAEVNPSVAVVSRESGSTLAAVRGDPVGDQVLVGERLAQPAVIARAREDVDVQLEKDRFVARIAHRDGKRFVVEQREGVGNGPPTKEAVFRDVGIRQRIGQLEVERILLRIRHGDGVFEQLAVVGHRLQLKGYDGRPVLVVGTPRMVLIQSAQLTGIVRIVLAIRKAGSVQKADIFAVNAKRPTALLVGRRARSATRVEEGDVNSFGGVMDAVVGDADFQVHFLSHVLVLVLVGQRTGHVLRVQEAARRRRNEMAIAAPPHTSVEVARKELAAQPRRVDESGASDGQLIALFLTHIAQALVANGYQSRRSFYIRVL